MILQLLPGPLIPLKSIFEVKVFCLTKMTYLNLQNRHNENNAVTQPPVMSFKDDVIVAFMENLRGKEDKFADF